MRPSTQIPFRTVYFGDFQANFATGELRKNGQRVKIQDQPLKILALLLRRPGELVTREELRGGLWSDETFVDFDRGLNTAVNRLRAALRDSAENPRFVETVGRHGYRFIGSVAVADSETGSISPQRDTSADIGQLSGLTNNSLAHAPQSHTSAKADSAAELHPTPTSLRKWLGGAISLLLGASVAFGLLLYGWHRPPSQNVGSNLRDLRIAKLTSSGRVEDVAVSPDGAYIVYSQRDSRGSGLWLHHIESKSDTQILPSEEVDFRGLTFSRDGNSVYFVRTRKEIATFKDLYVIPVLGGTPRLLTRDIDSAISFSPDGNRFVYARGVLGPPDGNEIRIANADGTQDWLLTKIADTQGNVQTGATWSPDGQTIAVSMMLRGERTGYVLYAISPVDGSMREVIRNQRGIGRPLWLPDSQSVLVAINDSTGRGQLWDVSIRRGDKQRVTNDLANWGTVIDVARDAHRVTAVQWTLSANIWEATGSNPTDAHQITFGEVPIVASLPLKRTTFVVSADGQLWTLNGKSRQRLPFSTLRDVGPPVQCGRFVVVPSYQTGSDSPADAASVTATQLGSGRVAVLRSYQSGPARIMRLDSDGLNATMLASGLVFSPTCSPDGRDLFYVSMPTPQKIMRVPVEGGTAHVVGNIPGATVRGSMKASPDGKFLAFPYDVYGSTPGLKLGIVSVNQGQLVKSFDAPMGIYRESCLRWAPDGKSLQYLLTTGDVTNIWEQPLSGGSAHQFTQFASGRMFDFNWSTDGKTILMSRGEVSGDVVLLTKSF